MSLVARINPAFRVVHRQVARAVGRRRHQRLAELKQDQRERFAGLVSEFADVYASIRSLDIPEFVEPYWASVLKRLERHLLPRPPFGFLGDAIVMNNMVAASVHRWTRTELEFIESHCAREHLPALLEEDLVGEPVLMRGRYRTSANTVHHAYHLMRYVDATSASLDDLRTVVEWGGGYGNQARIYSRRLPQATFVLVDVPLLAALQWLYLAAIKGRDKVQVVSTPQQGIQRGKINVVPVALSSALAIEADLFVSTWGLSASAKPAQYMVADELRWFGAPRLLLAAQPSDSAFPQASLTGSLAVRDGAEIQPLSFLRGNSYAFR